MEKKYQLIPLEVENYIRLNYSFMPSVITFPLITMDGFETLESLKKIWTIDYFTNKKIYTFEGLLKYNDTDIFIYYRKSENENTYQLVFIFNESSKDSVIFIINSLTKFNVKDHENFNNRGI